jgi:hypothetical protein
MAISAFFLDLRIAIRVNFSLNHPSFILDAAHDTCTKTERRYLLPLVVAVLLYLPALSSFLGRSPAQPAVSEPVELLSFRYFQKHSYLRRFRQ